MGIRPKQRRGGYVGGDRRGRTPAGPRADGRWWALATAVLAATAIAGAFGIDRMPLVLGSNVQVLVRTLAVVLVCVLVALTLAHHRATGLAIGKRLTLPIGVLGVAATFALLPAIVDPAALSTSITTDLTRTVLTALAGACLLWALSGPQIDGRSMHPAALTVGALTAVAIGVTVVLPAAFVVPLTAAGLDHLLPAAAWLVGAGLGWRHVRRRPEPLGYAALTAAPLIAAADALRLVESLGVPVTVSAVPMLRAAALVSLVVGAALGLADSSLLLRSRQHEQQVERRLVADAVRREQQRHAHEVRNALVAIEGATLRLRVDAPADDVAERDQLAAALADGVGHLRRLLETASPGVEPLTEAPLDARASRGPGPSPRSATVSPPTEIARVSDVVNPALVLARARGLVITTSLTDAEVAMAPIRLRQTIDNLLTNVERHAGVWPRCHLVVRATDRWVELVLDDDGPGIRPAARRDALARGGQVGENRTGRGLGLGVIADVVTDVGGRLTLGQAPMGGLRVHVQLPRAGSVAGPGQLGEHRSPPGDDGDEVHQERRRHPGSLAADVSTSERGR